MKKILAAALAVLMATAVMASCGDKGDDSKTESKTTTAAASKAETESKSEDGDDENTPKPTSDIPGALKNQETASLKFTTDMNAEDFVSPLAASNYEDDESHVNISIAELEGVPMVKVETLDKNDQGAYKVMKIHFDMSKLFKGQEADLEKIFSIKADVISKGEEETTDDEGNTVKVATYTGGKIVTQPADSSWNELYEFGESEWVSEWAYYELEGRPGIKDAAKFKNSTDPQYFAIMKWADPDHPIKQDFYIANLTFLDEDGNVIACNYGK